MDLCDDVIREIVKYLHSDGEVFSFALCSHQFYDAIFRYDDDSHLLDIMCFGISQLLLWDPLNVPTIGKLAASYDNWYYFNPPKTRSRSPAVIVGGSPDEGSNIISGDILIHCRVPKRSYTGVHFIECEMPDEMTNEGNTISLHGCTVVNREMAPGIEIGSCNIDAQECVCLGGIQADTYEVQYSTGGRRLFLTGGWAIIDGEGDADTWNQKGTIVLGKESYMYGPKRCNKTRIKTIKGRTASESDEEEETIDTILILLTEDDKYIDHVIYHE